MNGDSSPGYPLQLGTVLALADAERVLVRLRHRRENAPAMPTRYDRANVLVQPPRDVGDINDIWQYAHEGVGELFDGYHHAETFLGAEAHLVADPCREAFRTTGTWRGSFEELRVCLFLEARAARHSGWDPPFEDMRALVDAIRAAPMKLDTQRLPPAGT